MRSHTPYVIDAIVSARAAGIGLALEMQLKPNLNGKHRPALNSLTSWNPNDTQSFSHKPLPRPLKVLPQLPLWNAASSAPCVQPTVNPVTGLAILATAASGAIATLAPHEVVIAPTLSHR